MYNERDPQWAGKQLGACGGVLIGQAGCLLCVDAQIVTNYGWPTRPDWMNDDLVRRGGFLSCNLLPDEVLHNFYPDKIAPTRQVWPQNGRIDMRVFDDHSTWKYVCVPVADHVHFLLPDGWDGKTLTVGDPWTGRDHVPFPQATGGSPDPSTGILRVVVVPRVPAAPVDPFQLKLAAAKQLAQQILNL